MDRLHRSASKFCGKTAMQTAMCWTRPGRNFGSHSFVIQSIKTPTQHRAKLRWASVCVCTRAKTSVHHLVRGLLCVERAVRSCGKGPEPRLRSADAYLLWPLSCRVLGVSLQLPLNQLEGYQKLHLDTNSAEVRRR